MELRAMTTGESAGIRGHERKPAERQQQQRQQEEKEEEEEEEGEIEGAAGLFEDPEDFYPPSPPPTTQTHRMRGGQEIRLRLVGHSPLEAHRLWNGSRLVSDFLEARPAEVRGRTVLELGAGAGLPSIVCAVLGARMVVVTDFPDADLVENMRRNILDCEHIPEEEEEDDGRTTDKGDRIMARGFVWGGDPQPLLACLPPPASASGAGAEPPRFDVLILADLLFRHSEHGRLLDTVEATLRRARDSRALVFFTSYRPWLAHKDLAFFDLARTRGFAVDRVAERRLDRPMFDGDPGDEEVQRTVTGYALRWPQAACAV